MTKKWVYLIICFVALVLIIAWFKDGYMLGHAESALPFYNLHRYFDLTSFAWTEYPGLGNVSLITVASKPTYFLLSKIQEAGLPDFVIQAGVFWFLLVSAGVGIVLLTNELFGRLPNRFLILAVFFYWFNPLSLVNVWNRFLINYIFFFGALPLFCFLFIKGLKKRSYIWSVLLTLALGVYSYTFSYLAFTILLWFIFLLLTLLYGIYTKDSKVFYVKYFVLTLILFILSNLWWISQLLALDSTLGFGDGFRALFNDSSNTGTLDAISQKLGNLVDILRFSNATFTKPLIPFISFLNPLIEFLEFSFLGIILYTLIKNKRELFFILYCIVLFIIIFLSKGSNAPFGEIYRFLFEQISVLQILRNPVEKFSFLMTVIFTPLFSYSLYYLVDKAISTNKLFNFFRKMIYPIFFIFIVSFWGFPFFTGSVFIADEPPSNDYVIGYKTKVPNYYSLASAWLEKQKGNFRYIGFPLDGEGITYKWEKGYTGLELSSALFSTPGILLNTSVPFAYNLVPQIEKFLFTGMDFYKLANMLNARYYFVRNDIDFQEREMRNPKDLEEKINSQEKDGLVKKVSDFGKLTFWENLKWQDSTIYPATEITTSTSISDIFDLSYFNIASGSALIFTASDIDPKYKKLISTSILHPSLSKDQTEKNAKLYTLNLPETEEFNLFLDTGLTEAENKKALQIPDLVYIDGKPLDSQNAVAENNVISYPKLSINRGSHKVLVKSIVSENLVKGVNSNASNSYKLIYSIDHFNPFFDYLIDIEYPAGEKITLSFIQNTDKIRDGKPVPKLKEDLNSNETHYQHTFTPNSPSSQAWLELENKRGNVKIKNAYVYKQKDPKPVLVSSFAFTKLSAPTLSYKKINPTKYIISIKNATAPFLLVFSELYNNKWQASYNDNLSLPNHTLANFYANSWYVDRTGTFNITIDFTPQSLMSLGEKISLAVYILCSIFIIILLIRKGVNR